MTSDGSCYAVRSGVDPRISAVVLVPPSPVSTELARGLLPAEVPHADAAANAGRTALLVAALAGQPEQLWRATRDYLHQQQRRTAMPESMALVEALRADGVPAVISGAGPTVLAFANGPSAPGTADLLARCPDGWTPLHLGIDPSRRPRRVTGGTLAPRLRDRRNTPLTSCGSHPHPGPMLPTEPGAEGCSVQPPTARIDP